MNRGNNYTPPAQNWTVSATSLRLSIFLVLFSVFVLPLPSPEQSQLLWLAAQQAAFAIVVLVVLQYLPASVSSIRRALLVSIAMIAFVLSVGITMRNDAVAMLLFVPVINAALHAGGRGLYGVTAVSAAVWLYLHSLNHLPDWWEWTHVMAGIGPLALVAGIVRTLRGDSDLAHHRLTAMSHQDELTGVLNMRAFTRLLMAAHAHTQQAGGHYALLMVDICNLQAINEKYGHEQGNKAIMATAEALKRSIRSDDLLARYGGDEFIIYLAGAADDVAQAVSNRIGQNVYNITLSFERGTERISVNTGIAIYPDSGATVQAMMNFADKAMYREKEFRERARPDVSASNVGREQAGLEPR